MLDEVQYKRWNLEPVELPERSCLYSLPPIEIGTPQVESLNGYVTRLAEAHTLSVGDLVGRKPKTAPSCWLSKRTRFYRSNRPRAHVFHAIGYEINGMCTRTHRWVRILKQATCQERLDALTLSALRPVLSDMSLFRHHRAWCPSCYQDDRRTGIVYERLLWTIHCVTLCPLHHRRLEDKCPFCHETLRPLAVHSRPGYCSSCGRWLGNEQITPQPSEQESKYGLYAARSVGEILAACSQGRLSKKIFRTNLTICVGRLTSGNGHAFAELSRVSKSALYSWCAGKMLPRLDALLRLCFHLGIPAVMLLASHRLWGLDWSKVKGLFRQPRQIKQQHRTSEELHDILATVLAADDCPSISELSRSLGYKRPERLYQVDPILCHRITQKHRNGSRTHWWRLRGAKRICDIDKLRTLLEESLAQDPPVPVRRIAKCSGYLNGGFIQRKFPNLCRAIVQKRKLWENRRLDEVRQAVKTACLEQPPPTLTDLSKRLGFNHSSSLRLRFPHETDQLLRARQSYERKEMAKLGNRLLRVLNEEPAPSLSHIASRLGISQSYLREKYPDGSRAISKRYLQDQSKRTHLKRDLLNEEVYRIVRDLHAQGQNPTHTTIGRLLSKESIEDWSARQKAIKAARRSLGLAS